MCRSVFGGKTAGESGDAIVMLLCLLSVGVLEEIRSRVPLQFIAGD